MDNLTIIKHPLISHKLTHLRKKETNSKEFREYLEEISRLMAFEVFKNIKLEEIEIETPLNLKTKGYKIAEEINIYPILRAGLGMVRGFQELIPNSKVGHIGLYRDVETLEPVKYLLKYPKNLTKKTSNIILDPMLATGGTAIEAINNIKEIGAKNIILVALVVSKFAIEKIKKAHPDIKLFVVAVDDKLNSKGYIEPGLGDAGDRIFGTK